MRNPYSLKGQLFRLATKFWTWGFTPGIVIRTLGPLGIRWSSGYAQARSVVVERISNLRV